LVVVERSVLVLSDGGGVMARLMMLLSVSYMVWKGTATSDLFTQVVIKPSPKIYGAVSSYIVTDIPRPSTGLEGLGVRSRTGLPSPSSPLQDRASYPRGLLRQS